MGVGEVLSIWDLPPPQFRKRSYTYGVASREARSLRASICSRSPGDLLFGRCRRLTRERTPLRMMTAFCQLPTPDQLPQPVIRTRPPARRWWPYRAIAGGTHAAPARSAREQTPGRPPPGPHWRGGGAAQPESQRLERPISELRHATLTSAGSPPRQLRRKGYYTIHASVLHLHAFSTNRLFPI